MFSEEIKSKLKIAKNAASIKMVLIAVRWLMPRSRNLWWMWVRSGKKGFLPRRMRPSITRMTSRQGTMSRAKAKTRALGRWKGASAWYMLRRTANSPRMSPMVWLPQSPIKNFIVLVGLAEHVEAEEGDEGAEGNKGDEGVNVFVDQHEDTSHKEEGHATQAAGQSVDTVYQVDGVDAVHDEQHTQGHTYPFGDFINPKEAVKVVDPYAGKHNHEGTEYLHHELGLVAHADKVVGYAFEVEQHHGTEREGQAGAYGRHVFHIAKITGKGGNTKHHAYAEQDGRGKGNTPQTRNNTGVHLALVDGIEELFLERNEDDFGNDERGNAYAEHKTQKNEDYNHNSCRFIDKKSMTYKFISILTIERFETSLSSCWQSTLQVCQTKGQSLSASSLSVGIARTSPNEG